MIVKQIRVECDVEGCETFKVVPYKELPGVPVEDDGWVIVEGYEVFEIRNRRRCICPAHGIKWKKASA